MPPEPVKDALTQAFAERYSQAAPAVFAWICGHLGPSLRNEVEPEDVLQEVACRAFAKQGSFDPARGPFRAWLFGIARHVLYQCLERLATHGRPKREWLTTGGLVRIPEEATTITQRLSRDDGVREFLDHLAEIEESDRQLVLQRGLEGLSHVEVGSALGLDPQTVAKRWERLRKRLRESPVVHALLADAG